MNPQALFTFPSGLYVVSANTEDDYGACVINTGLQVTAEPLQVQVVVNKQNHTAEVIERAGHFALCPITTDADMLFIGRFGFRSSLDFAKFDGIESATTELGDQYPAEKVAAVIGVKVNNTVDVGTHLIFIGTVEEAETIEGAAEPLTYAYYHSTLKGKTPPKASSYIAEA